ncbi:MAG: hypothetical protein V2I43_19360, partial [Parvularcula sp.]|nr:hypothetical protein [Parvularcula sp.]
MVHSDGMARGLFLCVFGLVAACGIAVAAPVPVLKPLAPVSPYVSKTDAQFLEGVITALERGRYDEAKRLRDAIAAPLPRAIAQWGLLGSSADGLSLEDYDVFLDNHPGWPNPVTLQRKAERLIGEDTPADAIIAFFESRDPVSGFGKLHLGRALLAMGNEAAGADS